MKVEDYRDPLVVGDVELVDPVFDQFMMIGLKHTLSSSGELHQWNLGKAEVISESTQAVIRCEQK